MLWLKAFHIIFMVTWFAGLFYLPRLFVYYSETESADTRATLAVMQRRLLKITHIGGGLTLVFGILLIVWFPGYLQMGWIHAKLTLVLLLVVFHGYCGRHVKALAAGAPPRSSRYYRWINELPVFVLIPVVLLAVLRPF